MHKSIHCILLAGRACATLSIFSSAPSISLSLLVATTFHLFLPHFITDNKHTWASEGCSSASASSQGSSRLAARGRSCSVSPPSSSSLCHLPPVAAPYSRKRGPEALYLYGPRDPGAFRADRAELYGESTIVVFPSSPPHKSLLFIYFSCPGEMSWQRGGGVCLPAGKASVQCVCVGVCVLERETWCTKAMK